MDDDLCTIECTVCTGFEEVAREEAMEVLGVNDVQVGRGHILITMPVKDATKVLTLNGIDNCVVRLHKVTDFGFTDDEVECMVKLQHLVERVNWKSGIKVWFKFFSFHLPISDEPVTTIPIDFGSVIPSSSIKTLPKQAKSNRKDYGRHKRTKLEKKALKENKDVAGVTEKSSSPENDLSEPKDLAEQNIVDKHENSSAEPVLPPPEKKPRVKHVDPSKPSFRATCYRTGQNHVFNSMCAAANFGGAVQTYFGWNVEMRNFDIEVVLTIVDDDVAVGIALTKTSLHRRLITDFGPTTLRPTTAYNMLRMCKIQDGEVVCDPMCGSGSIPIQSAVCWPKAINICGEIHPRAMEKIAANIKGVNEMRVEKSLPHLSLSVLRWNACKMPLPDQSVDVFITDLPFGKRVGSRKDNWKLYPAVMHEMARVAKLDSGRVCLLTQDKKCMFKCMQHFTKYWKKQSYIWVNIGGLIAGIWLFRRTGLKITGQPIPTLWHASVPDDCEKNMPLPDNAIEHQAKKKTPVSKDIADE